MTSCTFAGHREVYQPMLDAKIEKAIRELLQTDSEFIFYTGGMGEFDSKCASAVRLAKRKYPHLKICLALVLPYMSNRLNTERHITNTTMMKSLFQRSCAAFTTKPRFKSVTASWWTKPIA